jgi:hypothetical protein
LAYRTMRWRLNIFIQGLAIFFNNDSFVHANYSWVEIP